MTEFFEIIKQRRKELGLSQDELAEKMGYKDRSMIAKIESGKVDISQSKIEAFAKALDTTPAHLMGWETHEENIAKESSLTRKDERDIDKSINEFLQELEGNKGLMLDGEPVDEESLELLVEAMKFGLQQAKKINKQRFGRKNK